MSVPHPQRSMLFLPGLRTDRFERAAASNADIVCLDLEDAVAPQLKAQAREAVLSTLNGQRGGVRLAVRINGAGSPDGADDLLALATAEAPPDIVVLPKANGPEEIGWLISMLPPHFAQAELFAIIETARGLEAACRIATASPRVTTLVFGAADLCAELGCTLAWEPLLYARSRVVHAAAIAGLAVMDVPYLDVDDETGLRAEVAAVRRLGFTAKAAIHPKQVSGINEGFAPSAAEEQRARRVLEAFDACKDGVCLLDGRLVELPVIRAARRTLSIAAALRAA